MRNSHSNQTIIASRVEKGGKNISQQDIAIIGISGRFPGEATSPSKLWDMVKEGRNAQGQRPKSRFSADGFYHKDPGRAGSFGGTKLGYFVSQEVDRFDASFFSITPEEAKAMDPVQRLLLETAYEGIENAGLKIEELSDQPMGCFIGGSLHDYWDIQALDLDSLPKYSGTGTGGSICANRISWFFNLKGPSMTLDTACSSSMTAMHLACQSIRSGESDSALVGGFSLQLLPNFAIFISPMSFLSADDKCHSFDSAANGYARAEGGGFLVLKQLDKALRDGDTIRAVVRASGANQDGRTLGLTQPSAIRQAELIRSTYASAGLPLEETNYFEAHGTGTKSGDPIECSAIGAAFAPSRQRPLFVGSVKSNVGHLEGVSGIVGMIKTVCSLESGWIAPTHGLENVNPKIRLKEWKIDIPRRAVPWPPGLRRASINSFGYGGANAHVILDDAYHYMKSRSLRGHHNTTLEIEGTGHITSSGSDIKDTVEKNDLVGASDYSETNHMNGINGSNGTNGINSTNGVNRGHNGVLENKEKRISRLFFLSSNEDPGIDRLSQKLQTYIDNAALPPNSDEESRFLHRLAFTLSEKRSSLPWKTFAVASTIGQLRELLDGSRSRSMRVPSKARALTFIFTGQGAQWFAMGRALQNYPVFLRSLNESNSRLRSLGCTWDLIEELNRSIEESQVDLPHISQPACTALQIAVVDLLESWRIRPQVTIGHSSGEIAAAYAKGAFGKAAAMRIAYYRGVLTGHIGKTGAMAAVGVGVEVARGYLDHITNGKAVIACINSPKSVTLSGDTEGIDEVLQLLQKDDIFARKLRVSTAYHSHHMRLVADEYLIVLSGAWQSKAGHKDVTMFSSVKAKPVDGTELDAAYWVANLVSPVNFSGAVTAAAHAGLIGGKAKNTTGLKKGSPDAVVEIGPHAALQGPLKQILDGLTDLFPTSPRYLSVIKRNQDAIQTTLEVAGQLHVLGHPVDVRLAKAYDTYRADEAESGRIPALVDLPPYAWNTSNRYWSESAAVAAYRNRKHPRLELLGLRDERSTDTDPCWRNLLRISEQPWIEDHQFQNTNIYPMAGMIVMAIEGMRQMQTRTDVVGYQVRDISIGRALVVPFDQTVETRLQLAPWRSSPLAKDESSYWTEFKVSSRSEGGTWTPNCTGLITTIYSPKGDRDSEGVVFVDEEAAENQRLKEDYESIREAELPSLEPSEFYDTLDKAGFHLGPAFQGIKELNLRNGASQYTMEVIDTKQWYPSKWEAPHLIHPSVLDVFVHLLTSSAGYGANLTARMPVSAASIYISADFDSTPQTKYHGFTRTSKIGDGNKLSSDVFAYSELGGDKPTIALRGCQTVPLYDSEKPSDPHSGTQNVSSFLGGHVPVVPKLVPDVTMADRSQLAELLDNALDLSTAVGQYVSLFTQKYPETNILEYNSEKSLLQAVLGSSTGCQDVGKHIKSITLCGATKLQEEPATYPEPWMKLFHQHDFDLVQDPVAHGLTLEHYDLVVLRMDQEFRRGESVILANIRKLLKPSGVLVLANDAENRFFIRDSTLASGGFATPSTIAISDATSLSIAHTLKSSSSNDGIAKEILLVLPRRQSYALRAAVKQIERYLDEVNGYHVVEMPFDASIPDRLSSYWTLIALDLDAPFLEDVDEQSFVKLRSLLLGTKGALWLTMDNEYQGLVKGLGRTIRAEHPEIPFASLILDLSAPLESKANLNAIDRIFSNMSTTATEQSMDFEYVGRGGQILVERLEPEADLKVLLDTTKSGKSLDRMKITLKEAHEQLPRGYQTLAMSFREPGLLHSFEYQPVAGLSDLDPVAEGQMEIEVRSIGIGFRDIMVAMGQMEDSMVGMECSGIVTKLGPGVNKFQLGDRVFGLKVGGFQNRVRVDPRIFERTPDHISDEVAGGLMGMYQTAVQALINVAHIQSHESLLIHSGAGGLGQATIILAQHLGVEEIFVTVSSNEKKKYLMKEYGIRESHILYSRDFSFADGIMRITNGGGVDVVINSLANEALRRTWRCVAPFGRFIEVGKRDMFDNTGLEMRPFLDNITFAGLDISVMITEFPDRCERIGKQVAELLNQRAIRPLGNIMQYNFGQVEEAFRILQGGNHIGKIVMIPKPDSVIPVVPGGLRDFRLPPDSTYVLVGGLGGIGRSIANMLVEKGAKHLVFLSRSGSTRPEARAMLDELERGSVSTTVIAVDVADKEQLQEAIDKVKHSSPPIKGMVNCAMDLRDGIYENMSAKDWNLSLRPKLQATRNLHELLPNNLDFFICLSSIAGVIGSRGQANYNAGNNYQDALMRHRAALGQAAASLNLSLVVGIGVSTERDGVFQLLKNGGLLPMDEADVLNLVAAAITGRTPVQVALGASTGGQLNNSSSMDPYWFADSRFSIIDHLDRHEVAHGGDGNAEEKEDWKKSLAVATSKEQVYDLVFNKLLLGISSIIKADVDNIDPRKSLPALGIDSLVAIEVRNWLRKEFKADMSVFDIVSNDPLTGFVDKLIANSALVPNGFT